ncbi:unnamed protein product [Calypogeia fissa]
MGLASSRVSMPSFFHDGSAQVDAELERQQEDINWEGVVTSISINKTPLPKRSLPGVEGLPGMPTHHFLVVELSDVVHPNRRRGQGRQLIRAEKASRDHNGENAGIGVKYVRYIAENDYEELHKVDHLGLSVPIAHLVQILTGHSPHYDLIRDNCWKYANTTLRALLTKFGDLHPEDSARMDGYIQDIPPLSMPGDIAVEYTAYATVALAMGGLITVLFKGLRLFFGSRQ